MFKKIVLLSFLVIFLNSCATPHVVSVIGANDSSLSCSQLDGEIAIASNYKRDAKAEKSYGTATNVGALLFWLPGMVATQMNANDAIRAADERINHLTRLKSKKSC
tara:strand:- start:139 stop:456 length:318 start_codon:yes stop_codon:yes gene_type:complete